MSFLIGLSFLILLSFWTIVLYFISKMFTAKEFLLLPILLMFFGDALLVGMWYYGWSEFVVDIKSFRLGIGLSFMTCAFGRSLYFMYQNRDLLNE
jgi:hypothetical protein